MSTVGAVPPATVVSHKGAPLRAPLLSADPLDQLVPADQLDPLDQLVLADKLVSVELAPGPLVRRTMLEVTARARG